MEVVKTISNGDCFFDALLLSKTIPIPPTVKGVSAQRQYLRDYLVDYLLDNVSPDVMPPESIEELYEAGKYACDAGDLVPIYASAAFDIRLHIYDLQREPSSHYVVVRHRVGTHGPIVSVLRSGEHFRLLRPTIQANELHEEMSAMPSLYQNDLVKTMKAFHISKSEKALASAKELAQHAMAAEEANTILAKKLAQEEANTILAKKLAQNNLNWNMTKKAQEEANAIYASTLKGGKRRRLTKRKRRSAPKTRRR